MISPSISRPAPKIAERSAQTRLRARDSQLSVGLGLVIAMTFSGVLWMAGVLSVHSLLA